MELFVGAGKCMFWDQMTDNRKQPFGAVIVTVALCTEILNL